jgi:hypothetical protein
MSEHDHDHLAKVLADKFTDVGVAILAIVAALKNQPKFDRTAFDNELRERLANPSEGSFSKLILSHALDAETPPDTTDASRKNQPAE